MDDYLQKMGKSLQAESVDLTRFVESEHKELAAKTYECMANCFRSSAPAEECRECASHCNSGIQQFQQDLEVHVKSIQNNYRSCMQNCAIKIIKDEGEELKACATSCYEETVSKFQTTRDIVKDLISRYQ